MAVVQLTPLRRLPQTTGALGLYSATRLQQLTGASAYGGLPTTGDTIRVPEDPDLVVVAVNPASVTLGVPLTPGALAGQRLVLVASLADLVLPADPLISGGQPVTVSPGVGATLVWDGTVWTLVGGAGASPVQSVFGRVGAVTAQDADYASSQITDATAGLAGTRVDAKLADAKAQIDAALAAALPVYRLLAGTGPAVSGMGLATYVTASTPLPAGTYLATWDLVCTCTASGAAPGAVLTLGATQIPTATLTSGSAPSNGAKVALGASGTVVHPGGALTVLLQVNRSAGTGNVIPQAAQITIRRAV